MEKVLYYFTGDSLTNSDTEPLLQKIMTVIAQQDYSKTIAHNLRAVTSELLSNIVAHAVKDENANRSITLKISETSNKSIQIQAQNLIQNACLLPFTTTLNNINHKTQFELKEMQQRHIEENINEAGSAHIGLIIIRRKCCKPITCKIEHVNNQISYITLEMELKAVQQNLKKEATKRTPLVKFDQQSQTFEISGVSFPEDAEGYYSEIESWILENEQAILDMQNPTIKIDLEYFNSTSLKQIVRTLRCLLGANKERFTVNWYYDSDDEISYEEGVEMSEILHKEFNFIQKK